MTQQNYRMVQNSNTIELSWQYNFAHFSDVMAIEYAKRHAMTLNTNMMLWRETDGDWRPIADIKVKTVTTATHEEIK
jgi:hypothetical protein